MEFSAQDLDRGFARKGAAWAFDHYALRARCRAPFNIEAARNAGKLRCFYNEALARPG